MRRKASSVGAALSGVSSPPSGIRISSAAGARPFRTCSARLTIVLSAHGSRSQRGEQVGPALFNPEPNLLLLCKGQQRPFAELAEVQAHEIRILVRDGTSLEHLFGLGEWTPPPPPRRDPHRPPSRARPGPIATPALPPEAAVPATCWRPAAVPRRDRRAPDRTAGRAHASRAHAGCARAQSSQSASCPWRWLSDEVWWFEACWLT